MDQSSPLSPGHPSPGIPAAVFRAYDIRGVAGRDFDEDRVTALGHALGAYFSQAGQGRTLVGRDCRETSPAYRDALVRGLAASGLAVIDIGEVPTPVFYYTAVHLKIGAGVMVTASHNPAPYNGFKIWMGGGTISGPEIRRIRDLLLSGVRSTGRGLISLTDPLPAYEEAVLQRIPPLARPLAIVVDGSNGAGGPLCAGLLERLGARVTRMFCEPDGRFPNHPPDPSVPDNMRALAERVRAEKADFGIGLDGDADRLGVLDRRGRLLRGDELAAILARDILSRRPGSLILGDVKCSRRFFEDITRRGGRAAMSPTGHSLIKAAMRSQGAAFAGDMSGHMYFDREEGFGHDDAIFAACRLASLAAAGAVPLEDDPGWEGTVAAPEILVACPDGRKEEIMAAVENFLAGRADGGMATRIDGIRLDFPEGWLLLRPSNTQPALTLHLEAADREGFSRLTALAREALAAAGCPLQMDELPGMAAASPDQP